MRKIFTYSAVAGLIMIAGFLLFQSGNDNTVVKKAHREDAGPYNIKERHNWEQLRFMDPATGLIPANARQRERLFVRKLPGSYNNIKSKNDRPMSDNWTWRGPYNIGGRTRALAFDILNEDIIIAAGVSGGMWKSTNAGQSWVKKTTPEQLHSVTCVAQDTRVGKENIWYYGTGEFLGNSAHINGDGMYKSTDGGESWQLLESTATYKPGSWENKFEFIWRIITNPDNTAQDEVFVATCLGGIYRSVDGGENWEPVLGSFGNSYSYFTDLIRTDGGVYYATMSSYSPGGVHSIVKGIYRSVDGVNWTDITPQFMPEDYNRVIVAAAPSDENQVYFIAETPESGKMTTNSRGDELWHSFWKYTYVSGDGTGAGGIWEDRSENIPAGELIRKHFNSQTSYDLVMKVKPDNPDVVFFGGTNLYRTNDGLSTSENTTHIGGYCPYEDPEPCLYPYRYPNHHADQHEIVFSRSNPDIMYTGSDGGIHKTIDPMAEEVEWISLNNGYLTTQFYSCAIDHASENYEIIGGLQDNGTLFSKWNDKNTPWTYPTYSDGFTTALADSGEYYYSSQNSSYQPKIKMWRFKLDEDGERSIKTRIDPIGGQDFIWNNPFKLDPNNTNIMYCAGGQILWRNNDLRSIPYEDTEDSTEIGWDSLSLPDVELLEDDRISALDISKEPANVVYFGTQFGRLFKMEDANTGDPYADELTLSKFPNANISCITVNPHDANKAIVVFSGYNIINMYYTEDGGQNWEAVSGNLEPAANSDGFGPSILWAEILPVAGAYRYYAGTSAGLFSTSHLEGDYTIWEQEAAGTIGNVVINMIDSRELDGFVAVGTHGLGMFSTFETALHLPLSAPELVYPSSGLKGIGEEEEFIWKSVHDAGMYKLQVAEDSDFENMIYEEDGITDTSITIDDIEQGLKQYYWRVFARGAAGLGNSSEKWDFESAIQSPELIYPEDKSDSLDYDLTLEWEDLSGADSYRVQVSTSFSFNKIILDSSGIIGNTLELSGLENNERYYWRVSALSGENEGEFSGHYYFKTKNIVSVKDIADNNINALTAYPNPFESGTEIVFNLEVNADLIVEIFDAAGRKVKVLESKYLNSGDYKYRFNGAGLPSGTYICRLKAGSTVKTMLLKLSK